MCVFDYLRMPEAGRDRATIMKMYQMEYLLAVCKYGSISRAADVLLVSRPAVSRAIKDLEDEFGVSFFLRTTTGVLMTDAGKLVYEKCQKFDQLLSELQAEIRAMKNGGTGYLVLENGFCLVLLLTCLAFIISGSFNPFIYFRF